ncbi:hypothetical protein [Corynebacterium variabile]|uniref:hypothetical protein n=1 Tax=Corynebacterium variabile TaxID=1727 RepID=UPI0026487AEB|nr:hypothetical protein [Corynebacterium variabile]MDN6478870.1 hypothetical protein [Corynebacterium variabile]MDN6556087.1 hypothetical protein [Acidipropionibacterium acidipropionici]MDN6814524.1 hypothetical protein [Corynebacterium variabile]
MKGCGPEGNVKLAVLTPGKSWSDATEYDLKGDGSKTVATKAGGWYSAVAFCVAPDGSSSPDSKQVNAIAFPTGIDFSPTSWTQGQALTLTTYGFQAGESVQIRVVHQKTGKVYWNVARTASASGDEWKNVFSNVVLPTGPAGNYDITMTGSQSGKVRSSVFYWQSPDSNGNGGGKPGTNPKAPAHNGDRPGLPSTGV